MKFYQAKSDTDASDDRWKLFSRVEIQNCVGTVCAETTDQWETESQPRLSHRIEWGVSRERVKEEADAGNDEEGAHWTLPAERRPFQGQENVNVAGNLHASGDHESHIPIVFSEKFFQISFIYF